MIVRVKEWKAVWMGLGRVQDGVCSIVTRVVWNVGGIGIIVVNVRNIMF
jgi:hypothetical protein